MAGFVFLGNPQPTYWTISMHWSDAVVNGITVTGGCYQVREHDGKSGPGHPEYWRIRRRYRLPMSLYLVMPSSKASYPSKMAKTDWAQLNAEFLQEHVATGISAKDWCDSRA